MPIVKHTLTFNAGEWSPLLDGRTDLEKYGSACRRLENFISRPQGAVSRRPGMQYLGRTATGATGGRVVEFERQGQASQVLVIAGGKMKVVDNYGFVQDGGSDLQEDVPWPDASLQFLRWKQINDLMFFVHPDYAPRLLERFSNTSWVFSSFVPRRNQPFLPENFEGNHRITTTFKTKADATIWATATLYKVGDRVKRGSKFYICENQHTSATATAPDYSPQPEYFDADDEEDRPLWNPLWVDNSSAIGQEVTLTSNKPTWTADHVGAYWEISDKRGNWDYEVRLAANKTAKGSITVYSKVMVVQGGWTFQSFGNWAGKFYIQISKDRGKSWSNLRAFQSTKTTPRNATAEGGEPKRVLMRLAFNGYSANGTSGAPFGLLSVSDTFVRGVVRITERISSQEVKAVTVESVEKGTTRFWAEGAWSDYQGYPRAIEFHQNRVVLAGTRRSPHTVWGSAVDDYNDFRRGNDADEPFAHTLLIGQREPIAWLTSDRHLLIGSSVGVFVLRGEGEDSPITPENGNAFRHLAIGSHLKGPGAIATDTTTLFVQHGGRIVRELGYQYQSDRYQAGNLNLLAEHLPGGEITDFAIQRRPFQIIWFVAGGALFSLTYEPDQIVAGWQRHTTTGTVISVACVRQNTEDDVYFIVNRDGTMCVERFGASNLVAPADNGWWSDSAQALTSPYSLTGNHLAGKTVVGWNAGNMIGPATLNSGFFTGLSGTVIVGLPYTAKLQPMTPEVGLQNGSSRSREARIHAVTLNLQTSKGGHLGDVPDGPAVLDPLNLGTALFTGEKEFRFEGRHAVTGNFCLHHSEPFPFTLRSLALKLNFYGDAG